MTNEFLKELKETRKTYADMIDFCCDNLLLNNDIISQLQQKDFYFDIFCGELNDYDEIYQYYLISERDAERLQEYTNELVIYNEELNLYVLCVTHWGTAWAGVPANWKE